MQMLMVYKRIKGISLFGNRIFKFGGQLWRTTNLKCQVFLLFEVIFDFLSLEWSKTLLLSAKYSNLRKTDTSVFLLAEKVRNANNEGSSWKSTAK
jgi:hypothetical protein